jgi:hypothetical protein
MALDTNDYVAYDTDGHYYYLTEAGAIEYSGKPHIATLWGNIDWRLKNMGQLLHDDYTRSVYNYKQLRYRNIDHIEYAVYANANGERDAIVRALSLLVILADDFDLDLEIMAGEKDLPETVRTPLRKAGLYFKGEFSGYIDEDDWRVGY